MKIVCWRKWGHPKLVKPKCLNNKTLIGSVKWLQKESWKVWLVDNTVYVLHRDWFSQWISKDDWQKIAGEDTHNHKFIYNDDYAYIALRNEAILSFDKPDLNTSILKNRLKLVQEFAHMLGMEYYDLLDLCRWEDFFMDILKLLKENEAKNKK